MLYKINSCLISLLLFLFLLSCENKKEKFADKSSRPANTDSTSYIDSDNFPNPFSVVDLSPMDINYFPVDYPILKMTNSILTPPVIRLIYSRPYLQGRKLFRDLLKFGQPWRLGANEATEIEFFRNVNIQGKNIPAGRFILYCIPEESRWTIVLNNNIDTWGLKIDSTKDFQRFEIPVTRNNPKLEYLTLVFEKTGKGADLVMSWSDFLARLPIEFTP